MMHVGSPICIRISRNIRIITSQNKLETLSAQEIAEYVIKCIILGVSKYWDRAEMVNAMSDVTLKLISVQTSLKLKV